MTASLLVPVDGIELEVIDEGSGEPVVLVQTALTADELRPLAEAEMLRNGYRRIVYHRRGYAASSPVDGPGSSCVTPRTAGHCSARWG